MRRILGFGAVACILHRVHKKLEFVLFKISLLHEEVELYFYIVSILVIYTSHQILIPL